MSKETGFLEISANFWKKDCTDFEKDDTIPQGIHTNNFSLIYERGSSL